MPTALHSILSKPGLIVIGAFIVIILLMALGSWILDKIGFGND